MVAEITVVSSTIEIMPERITIRDALANTCAKYDRWNTLAPQIQEQMIRRIERGCNNKSVSDCREDGISTSFANWRFIQRYSAICSRIITNLDIDGSVGSSYLLDKIIDDPDSTSNLAYLSTIELCPDASRPERDEIDLRKQQGIIPNTSKQYECKRCFKRETIKIEYQGRAADEASNYSIKCMACGHNWRN